MSANDSILVESAEGKVEELRQNLLCLQEEAHRERRKRRETILALEEEAIREENSPKQAKLYLRVLIAFCH